MKKGVIECTHLCGQSFRNRYQMRKHQKACPEPKDPVSCPYKCGRTSSLKGIIRHRIFCKKNPDKRIQKPRKERPLISLECEECGETYQKRGKGMFGCRDGKLRCDLCQQRRNLKQSSESRREWKLQNRYGLSIADYRRILDLQGGVCAICKGGPKENKRLSVDHNHASGAVRGLLCAVCNRAIGQLQDDISTLRAAATYILRHDKSRSWDHYFLEFARLAATRSKDPSSQVGAVVVRDRNILSTGYNGFPRGVNDAVIERYERPAKYTWMVHAEENALLNAGRNGVSTNEATLYVTPFAPCVTCAKAIIQSGIREVVIDSLVENPRWAEEFAEADAILKAARVLVRPPE